MIKRIYCGLTGHKINRHRVWNDGIDFRTACDRCGTLLLRDQAGWRTFDHERDHNPLRSAHPKNGG